MSSAAFTAIRTDSSRARTDLAEASPAYPAPHGRRCQVSEATLSAAHQDGFERTRQALACASDPLRLEGLLRTALAQHGFPHYALGFLPDRVVAGGAASATRQPFLMLNWPMTWLELYARQGFAADDVVVAEAALTCEPFTWSEIRARRPGASARIFAAAAEFGWRDGFVIPVHDPAAREGERFGVASLAATDLDTFAPAARTEVVALALTAFARARTLRFGDDRDPAGRAALSPRERQCLAYVAQGCGDAEIAALLNVSRPTAHFHIERAKKRLGAGTRTQAVAIALTRGLL